MDLIHGVSKLRLRFGMRGGGGVVGKFYQS